MDALLNLTMDPEVVDQKYMTANDITVGDVIKVSDIFDETESCSRPPKVTVRSIAANHMVVNISPHLTGLVLPTQYSETVLKHPERKYPEGKLVKARVGVTTRTHPHNPNDISIRSFTLTLARGSSD